MPDPGSVARNQDLVLCSILSAEYVRKADGTEYTERG